GFEIDLLEIRDPDPVLGLSEDALRGRRLALLHWGVFVLTDAATGTALGSIGFHGPPDDEGFVEIGYDLSPSARGAGWATEAVRLLAGWATARPEVRTVCALTEPENVASQRVLERAGFRFAEEREGLRAYEARAVPDPTGGVDGERLNTVSHPPS
ncbi:GNAT family N-acetyltransferase, partial [Streptomyces kronopolitis]